MVYFKGEYQTKLQAGEQGGLGPTNTNSDAL